jgi:hypothetical protein
MEVHGPPVVDACKIRRSGYRDRHDPIFVWYALCQGCAVRWGVW